MGPTIGFMDLTPTGNCSITGIIAGIDGQLIVVTNLSALTVTLNALNAGSAAANQFRMPRDIALTQNSSASFKYSVTLAKWVSIDEGIVGPTGPPAATGPTGPTGASGLTQNLKTVNYTWVLSDANNLVSMNGASLTTTIPANASVAFPIGTMVTIDNQNASTLLIAINTDTLILAGTTTTGTRTLARNGVATAVKTAVTTWKIIGAGLT